MNKELKKKYVCLIPARGKSKRIKNKNIKSFNYKPIISYSIELAKKCFFIKEIFVSTDSKKIETISKKYGAKVPNLRAKKFSGSQISLTEFLDDEIKKYFKDYDYLILLFATSPLLKKKSLLSAKNKIEKNKADILISTTNFSSNPLRAFKFDTKSFIKYKWPSYIKKRSQDLETLIHESGNFVIYKLSTFYKKKKKITFYSLDKYEGLDIDTLKDFKFAEYIQKFNKR
jgi:pseudaminic acid cytidylyltransferase